MAIGSFLICTTLILHLMSLQSTLGTAGKVATKKINVRRRDEYTFEGDLRTAIEECSYIYRVNETSNRNVTIQLIKEKVTGRNTKNLQKKNLENNKTGQWRTKGEESEVSTNRHGRLTPAWGIKRNSQDVSRMGDRRRGGSEDEINRRRKGSLLPSAFSTGSFTDYSNCSSRCVFARMGIVNMLGYPDESLIFKLIDDRITNVRIRLVKRKKVSTCFESMQKVAYTDSCIVSAKMSECLDFQEPYLWSGRN